jgi:hypothetical protein
MDSRNRDRFVRQCTARPGQKAYGGGLGILLLDDVYPGFPGDLRNASAWGFPVQYEVVPDLDIYGLVEKPDRNLDDHIEPIIAAARRLQDTFGCRAIAAECGFFAYFQEHVAAALDVPVFMSSMLQIAWIQAIIGPEKVVGVYTSSLDSLSDRLLEAVGTTVGSNYRLFDFYDCVSSTDNPETNKLWNTYGLRPDPAGCDFDLLEAQMVEAAQEMVRREPKLGAFLLECTGYQPFGRAIQTATGLPVFSWSTLLDFAWSAVNHRDFYGHV